MHRFGLATTLMLVALLGPWRPTPVRAQDTSGFEGRWTLNRTLSQFPREMGFTPAWAVGARPDPATGTGRSSGGSGASGAPGRPESEEEARRKQQLTNEVRTPAAHVTIADTATTFAITDERGQTRTFRPDGRDETIQIAGVPTIVNARRDAGRLVLVYKLEPGRELRYTYSRVQSPPQLVVEVQFLERGRGEAIKRVYEPASATSTVEAASGTAAAAPAASAGEARAAAPAPPTPAPPGQSPSEPFDQRPDAALKGLNTLGLVVEELSTQAVACGLSRDALETAVAKPLTDAGLRVTRNDDEDTYLYVNVISATMSSGACVSRYDAFLNTHTTARLSYRETPVLVEISLLHKGGIAGGAPAAHGQAVTQGLQEFVGSFATRIRDANR